MPTQAIHPAEILGVQLQATRLPGSRLRLGFSVPAPLDLQLRLRGAQGGWDWSESLGLVLPGDETAELVLEDWPEAADRLEARFSAGVQGAAISLGLRVLAA